MTTETSLEFVEAITFPEDSCLTITLEAADYRRLMKLAKTAALIEGHLPAIEFAASGYCPACGGWEVEKGRGCLPKVHTKDCWLGRAVADKIKEQA